MNDIDKIFKELELDIIIIAAFRYFLGRRTISTCCFAQDISKVWDYLPEKTKYLIKKELEIEFERDDEMRKDKTIEKCYYPLGHDCDRQSWELVRKKYKNL